MINAIITLKTGKINLRYLSDYHDNASAAGVGDNDLWTIYSSLKEDGEIKIERDNSVLVINNSIDFFQWLTENGYDYYVKNLYIMILKKQSHYIRYEK